MPATIVPPAERTCERCGRQDRWDDGSVNWVIAGPAGSPHCIHEWDINGNYNPVSEDA